LSILVFARKACVGLLVIATVLAFPRLVLANQDDVTVQGQDRLGSTGDGSIATLMDTANTLLSGLDLQGCVDSAASLTASAI
jgi:hypothetical protein